jgi:hypothetical protein
MKAKLWGVKAIRTTKRTELTAKQREEHPSMAAKLDKMPLAHDENVVRIMTGKDIGVWIVTGHISGDCLTNMKIDADGAVDAIRHVQGEGQMLNFRDVAVFEVEFDV